MIMEQATAPYPVEKAQPAWRSLFLICASIVFIRLIFTGVMGIMPQDAYYYLYSRHPALSYYDHPPMIAYLIRIFTGIFGKHVFVLKLTDTVVTVCTTLALYWLSGKFLDRENTRKTLLLFLSTLMVSILSLVSTPDVPLLLFWTLSLGFIYEALRSRWNGHWILAGIFSGLSFDSKYTAVFLLIGLIGFLIFSRKYRSLLLSPGFFIYLLCFGITILPVIIWNASNGFASFKFQSESRVQSMGGLHIDPVGFPGALGHQTAILLPFLLFSLVFFLFRYLRKYRFRVLTLPDNDLFLLSFFIPVFFGFFFLSFFYWVKLNWMMPAYISGIIWVSQYWTRKWLKYQLIFSLVLHLVMAVEILFYPVPVRSDDTWFGWKQLADKLETERKKYPRSFIFSRDDYKTSAVLNYYLPEMVYAKNVVGERALQFDFIGTDLKLLNGMDAIYVDSNPRSGDNDTAVKAPPSFLSYFDEVTALEPIIIEHHGRPVRRFSLFLCKNYHYR